MKPKSNKSLESSSHSHLYGLGIKVSKIETFLPRICSNQQFPSYNNKYQRQSLARDKHRDSGNTHAKTEPSTSLFDYSRYKAVQALRQVTMTKQQLLQQGCAYKFNAKVSGDCTTKKQKLICDAPTDLCLFRGPKPLRSVQTDQTQKMSNVAGQYSRSSRDQTPRRHRYGKGFKLKGQQVEQRYLFVGNMDQQHKKTPSRTPQKVRQKSRPPTLDSLDQMVQREGVKGYNDKTKSDHQQLYEYVETLKGESPSRRGLGSRTDILGKYLCSNLDGPNSQIRH